MIPWKFEWKLCRKPGAATSSVAQPPPATLARLEHEHPLPRLGEIAGARQPVVAAADDDDVVGALAHQSSSSQRCLAPSQASAGDSSSGWDVAGARERPGGRGVHASLEQPLDVRPVDLVDLGVREGVLLEPEVRRVDRLLVHPAEHLGAQVLQPVRVQVHDPELAQRLDVDDRRDERVGARGAVGDDVPLVVDDVGVAAGDVERVLHAGVEVHGADVGAEHVDAVEVRVGPVLEHPRPAARVADAGHGHRLARPVDDLGAVHRQRPHRLRVLAVGAADRAEVADVVGPEHRVEGVDPVAEDLDPAVVDVVRRARALPAPEVVLRGAVHDLALRRDDEEHVEVAVRDHLRPARLALDAEVDVVALRQAGEHLGLLSRDVDEEVAGGRDVGHVERLVGEAGEGSLGERDQPDRHVDPDHGHRRVDAVLDDGEVAGDVLALAHAVDDGREPDREVWSDWLRILGHVPPSGSGGPRRR